MLLCELARIRRYPFRLRCADGGEVASRRGCGVRRGCSGGACAYGIRSPLRLRVRIDATQRLRNRLLRGVLVGEIADQCTDLEFGAGVGKLLDQDTGTG